MTNQDKQENWAYLILLQEMDGVGLFEFDLKEDLAVREQEASEWGTEYQIEASCTESVSGKVCKNCAKSSMQKICKCNFF